MMSDLPTISELQANTDKNRTDFLHIDLDLCFTFADLVKTELAAGDRETANRVYAKAEAGYATISRFMPEVNDPKQRNEIEKRLAMLRDALDTLQHAYLNSNVASTGTASPSFSPD